MSQPRFFEQMIVNFSPQQHRAYEALTPWVLMSKSDYDKIYLVNTVARMILACEEIWKKIVEANATPLQPDEVCEPLQRRFIGASRHELQLAFNQWLHTSDSL